ncbi:hypothetical protein FRC10_001021 [Ceratobasidium sp. 414]|nr:hypothetical protein FRC10_001021 [Ceratobasidium sp. 414]
MATQCIGSTETGSLRSHRDCCPGQRTPPATLAEFGVTGGTGRLTHEEVRKYVALWMAESARAFSMINDRYLVKLLHPDARAHLPSRGTISKDIQHLYETSQDDIIKLLKSSNGLDFLGLVLFRLAHITPDKPVAIERFVLECLSFVESHTGENLTKTVYTVLCKFKIEHWVWGVMCDNASNNAAMMDKFKKMGLL